MQLLFDESALELALLVAGHVEDRRFKDDAPLLMDLLAVVYEVRRMTVTQVTPAVSDCHFFGGGLLVHPKAPTHTG